MTKRITPETMGKGLARAIEAAAEDARERLRDVPCTTNTYWRRADGTELGGRLSIIEGCALTPAMRKASELAARSGFVLELRDPRTGDALIAREDAAAGGEDGGAR